MSVPFFWIIQIIHQIKIRKIISDLCNNSPFFTYLNFFFCYHVRIRYAKTFFFDDDDFQ